MITPERTLHFTPLLFAGGIAEMIRPSVRRYVLSNLFPRYLGLWVWTP